jgi:hypothetical protein
VDTSEHLEIFPKPLKGARLDDLDHTFLPCSKPLICFGFKERNPKQCTPKPQNDADWCPEKTLPLFIIQAITSTLSLLNFESRLKSCSLGFREMHALFAYCWKSIIVFSGVLITKKSGRGVLGMQGN